MTGILSTAFWTSPSHWSSTVPQLWNHLWQSTLFAVAVALLALALGRYPARVRYCLWIAVSVKFLIPFSFLIAASAHFAHPTAPAQSVTSAYVTIGEMSEPFTDAPALTSSTSATPKTVTTHRLPLSAILAALWLCGFATVLVVWLIQWRRIAKSVRRATVFRDGRVAETLRRVERLARITRPIQLLSSSGLMEPGVFGILRPVLLWPESISSNLDDAHLEAAIAHEACHVRRRDNLTSLVHMVVEAIFWFHPLVWWMESQLVKERERACDEDVLLLCNQPQIYAESILKVCEFCVELPLKGVSGITGADLKERIARIMSSNVIRQLGVGGKCLLLFVALVAVAIPIALGHAKAALQAKAALKMALTASKSAPDSIRVAASAMVAEKNAPSGEESQAAKDTAAAVDATGKDSAFEVAVIRPTNRNDTRRWMGFRVAPSGRVSVSSMSIKGLAYLAYCNMTGTSEDGQVVGGPNWVDSDQFDIEAKVDDAQMDGWDKLTDAERTQRVIPMIRTLLAERFKLKLRTETRVTPVYALVQAKGGAKLKEVAPPLRNKDPQEQERMMKPDYVIPEKPPAGNFRVGADGWVGSAVRVRSLLGQIGYEADATDRPIVDETGLKGYYDFTANISKSQNEDGPSGAQQIEDQLGLKLEPRKMPMKTYVIESVEKPSLDGAETLGPSAL